MNRFDVVDWMAENGHPSYKREIAEIKKRYLDAADLSLDLMNDQVREIQDAAQDRYSDWVTDMLD